MDFSCGHRKKRCIYRKNIQKNNCVLPQLFTLHFGTLQKAGILPFIV